MYMSKLTGKTLKDVEESFTLDSQKLLIRSAMVRHIEPGRYSILPLGVKMLERLKKYITIRLQKLGFERINISSKDFIEDVMLSVRSDIKSYKELPAFLYDIQDLYRNDIKIKDGLLRSKEYEELRGISLHMENKGLPESYNQLIEMYKEILKSFDLEMVGMLDYNPKSPQRIAHTFIVKQEAGNRTIHKCMGCGYKALEEVADFYIESKTLETQNKEEVYTPDIKTIKELEEYLGIKAKDLAKTLLVKAKDKIVAVVIRGDRELNLYKLSRTLDISVDNITMAEAVDIEHLKTVPGFVGPVGLNDVEVIIDKEVVQGGTFVVGANKKDYHINNVDLSKEVENYIIAQVSCIKEEDKCSLCEGSLKKERGFHIGEIYSLGDNLNIKGLNYKDDNGKTRDMVCIYHYIDLYRLLSLIVEKNHDEYGILWPKEVAPYEVLITVLSVKNEGKLEIGEETYKKLMGLEIDVLLDDRNERAGSKFKDADLIGIPVRIVIGKRAEEGIVEYKVRWEESKQELSIEEALQKTVKLLR